MRCALIAVHGPSPFYFWLFYMLSNYVVVNLFITAILENFNEAHEHFDEELKEQQLVMIEVVREATVCLDEAWPSRLLKALRRTMTNLDASGTSYWCLVTTCSGSWCTVARLNEKDQIMRSHGLPAFDDFEAFEKHFLNKHGEHMTSDEKDTRAEAVRECWSLSEDIPRSRPSWSRSKATTRTANLIDHIVQDTVCPHPVR